MKLKIAVALLTLAVPGLVHAQVNPNAMRSAAPLDMNRINGMDRMNQIEAENRRQEMTRRAGTAAQRAERAERLTVLVNQGLCRTAYDTAIAEHDPQMAARIHAACTAEAAAAAEPQAPAGS